MKMATRGFTISTSSPRRSTAASCGSICGPATKSRPAKRCSPMIEPRDPDLLDARSIAQAEARVKAAEATLQQMEPELEKIHVQQGFAEAEMSAFAKPLRAKAFRNPMSKTPRCCFTSGTKNCGPQSFRKKSPGSNWNKPRPRSCVRGRDRFGNATKKAERRPTRDGRTDAENDGSPSNTTGEASGEAPNDQLELSDLFADRWPRAPRDAGKLRRRHARNAAHRIGRSARSWKSRSMCSRATP